MLFQFIVDQSPGAFPAAAPAAGLHSLWYAVPIFAALTLIILGLRRLSYLLQRPELQGLSRDKVVELWKQITASADQGVMGTKVAVMEADKLLDGVLRSMYVPGETMGERLKASAYKYPNIRKVWGAHRLRNQLVHDAAFEISTRQAKNALKDYEDALKTLRVL